MKKAVNFYTVLGLLLLWISPLVSAQPNEEDFASFRTVKKVRIDIEQSYGAAEGVNLQFDKIASSFFKYAGVDVVKDNYEATLSIKAEGRAIGVSTNVHELGQLHGKTELLYLWAEGNGTILFEMPSGKSIERHFEGKYAPENLPIFSEQEIKAKRNPKNAPFEAALIYDAKFPDLIAEMIGAIYGPDPLISALRDKKPEVGMGAASALGGIPDTRAFESLVAALKDDDWSVKKAASLALCKRKDARAIEPLLRFVASDKIWENEFILSFGTSLTEIAGDATFGYYIAALKHKDPLIREGAVIMLGRTKDVRAIEPLTAFLKDDNKWIKIRTINALMSIGDQRAVEPLIAVLSDEEVRYSVIEALGMIPDVRAVEPLIAVLKDKSQALRAKAAYALGKIKDVRAVPPLIAALNDVDWMVRKEAASALGKIEDSRAIQPLISALKDKDYQVYMAAASALAIITEEHFGVNYDEWHDWWEKNKANYQ